MKRLILLVISGVALLSLCGVGALVAISRAQGEMDIHSVPIYPGAANVQIDDFSSPSSSSRTILIGGNLNGSQSPGSAVSRMIPRNGLGGGNLYFTTKDSPQQVFAYYDKLYTNAGWTLQTYTGLGNLITSTSASFGNIGPSTHTYDYASAAPWLEFLPIGHPNTHATLNLDADRFFAGSDTTVTIFLFSY